MSSPYKALYDKRINEVAFGPKAPQRIVRYFPDTPLGNAHNGLAIIAGKHRIDVQNLSKGEYVIFVNKKQTALKMYAPGNVIAHLKTPHDTKLDPRIISLIPRFFDGKKIDYDAAIENILRKEFSLR